MKILYVSQYFPPEMGAPAARAAELAQHWTQAGHQVTVLTGFPNHPTGAVPPEYRRALRKLIMRETVSDVNVVRTWLAPLPNRKAWERMLNYSSFCISSATSGLFISRPDVVIATSPQLLVGLSGWWLARCKRVPFVFEVRDLWPESLTAVGVGDDSSMLHRFLARIAGFLYAKADRIVVVTSAFQEHLVQHWRVPPRKLAVVENGVETELFAPRQSDRNLRRELELENKFVVSYIGTMGMAHGLDTFLEAAQDLQTRAPDVFFLLVGEGADKERIASGARSRRKSGRPRGRTSSASAGCRRPSASGFSRTSSAGTSCRRPDARSCSAPTTASSGCRPSGVSGSSSAFASSRASRRKSASG